MKKPKNNIDFTCKFMKNKNKNVCDKIQMENIKKIGNQKSPDRNLTKPTISTHQLLKKLVSKKKHIRI